MPLDLSSVGFTTEPLSFSYDAKAVMLYALGIGAKQDELDYLYEGKGPLVYPTFAVVPAMPAALLCLARTGGDPAMVIHGGQSVRVHRPIPPEGTCETTATLRAVYDLKRLAEALVDTRTTMGGELVAETTFTILYRGGGGFGGSRPVREPEPQLPKDRAPDFTQKLATSREQALLYRLSGDMNPLHADPALAARMGFAEGPILHGLCTYGFVARAIVRGAAGGDARKLRRLDGQFRKPVWPGDELTVEGFRAGGGKIVVSVKVAGRPDPVMTGTWAELA